MSEEARISPDSVEQAIVWEIADIHQDGMPTPESEGIEHFEKELTTLVFSSPSPEESFEFAILFLKYIHREGELRKYKYSDILLVIDVFNRSFEGGHNPFSTVARDEVDERAHYIILSNYIFARFKTYFNLLDTNPNFAQVRSHGQTISRAKEYLAAMIKYGRFAGMDRRFWLILRQDMQIVLSREAFSKEFADVDAKIGEFFK